MHSRYILILQNFSTCCGR